jgi:hypothetical protein
LADAVYAGFLGHAPGWYKQTIVGFLVLNPICLLWLGPTFTGWLLLGQFIFTLAMSLRCYPLQPGGLLAIQSVLIGLTTAESVYNEVVQAFPVILLLIFMVAGIYFLRDLLLYVFTRLLLRIRDPSALSLIVDSAPVAANSATACRRPSSASTWSISGSNRCWSWISATITKNTTSSAVNGSAASNALPSRCSSMIPVKLVARMITSRPMRPTSATWNASDSTRMTATMACTISTCRSRIVDFARSSSE